MTEKRFLTEVEVSAIFGLGLRHLRAMRTDGTGPKFYKTSGRVGHTGGRVCYKPSDVERWIESKQCGSDPVEGERV